MPFVEDHHQLFGFLPSYGGMPSTGVREAIVGETLNFATRGSTIGVTQTTTLTRRPANSSATVAANAFTVDVPGQYTTTVNMAGVTMTYNVYAFPASFLTTRVNNDQPGASTPPKTLTRSHLAILVASGGVSTAMLAALEATSPTPTLSVLGPIAATSNLGGS